MCHTSSSHNHQAILATGLLRAGQYGFSIIMVMMAFMLVACERTTVFHQFEDTPVSGWEKNGTIVFSIPPQAQAGSYMPEVQLRVTNGYPFTRITLVADITCWQTTEQPATAIAMRKDTLDCLLYGDNGFSTGRGISYNQYECPLPAITLHPGDSLRIRVRHDMKREILPGIANVGVKLTRE